MIVIYGSSLSPFVRKVLAYTGEKGLEVELQLTGSPTPSAEFLEASPFRKMPAMRDGDYTLADSSAILHYLEAKHPDPALIPSDPEQRGTTIWFDEFADTILAACGTKMFFNRVVAPRFLGRPGDEAVAAAAERDELPPILDYIERIAPEPGQFLVGDGITLADLAVASPFANLRHLGIEISAASHPRACAYVESVLSRPSFKHWIDREAAFLARRAA